ncbi:prepilin-type N-terminal cleavage/methylation domain-containing protein [Streptococcus sanguinis]|uniref:type II secretion system protein n=1 Tax=Streptococcus sanguinis TaxID=1305 RepID=UPI002284EE83|nr:prepilin-type N-terminal cleavage/methylation domain-containing protein [Streptococcus sanguinis]MCY7041926.1 prepilin-type N-terminal cleavage/methylation domain-containing protein [Streptococcus sanguinis]
MKGLKKHKGVTLVEVLISLVLIGVITAGLLTFFAGSFNNILRQRGQNTINFDIQESFETELARIKKDGGSGKDIETFTYRVGQGGSTQSIDVQGTNLSYKDNKIKNIHLFAANAKESVLDIPSDLSVTIPNSKGFYYVGETTPGGIAGLKGDQQNSRARIYTDSAWFLSYSSISVDNRNIVPVGTLGPSSGNTVSQLVLPKMPSDFQQKSKLQSGVKITDEMRGRYLTFAARAVNSYGRVGSFQEAENRIWVMGLPVTSNLDVHTDADLAMLKSDDKTLSILPSDDQVQTEVDIRDYFHNTSFDSIDIHNVPVLNYYEERIQQARQLISLQGTYSMAFKDKDFRNGNSYTTSMLIGNRKQTGPLLTYLLDNKLSWGINLEEDGRIAVKTVDDTAANNGGQQYANAKLDYTKDNSIQVRSSAVNNILKLEIFVNGALVHTQQIFLKNNGVDHNVEKSQIIFGGETFINEFAIYTTALRDPDINKLSEYFSDKYRAK